MSSVRVVTKVLSNSQNAGSRTKPLSKEETLIQLVTAKIFPEILPTMMKAISDYADFLDRTTDVIWGTMGRLKRLSYEELQHRHLIALVDQIAGDRRLDSQTKIKHLIAVLIQLNEYVDMFNAENDKDLFVNLDKIDFVSPLARCKEILKQKLGECRSISGITDNVILTIENMLIDHIERLTSAGVTMEKGESIIAPLQDKIFASSTDGLAKDMEKVTSHLSNLGVNLESVDLTKANTSENQAITKSMMSMVKSKLDLEAKMIESYKARSKKINILDAVKAEVLRTINQGIPTPRFEMIDSPDGAFYTPISGRGPTLFLPLGETPESFIQVDPCVVPRVVT